MLDVFLFIFVADTKIIFLYDFVAPLNKQNFMSSLRENLTDSHEKLKLNNMNILGTLVSKQSTKLNQLLNQLNNTSESHTNKDPDNAVKCRY